jgi:hypothetical protein
MLCTLIGHEYDIADPHPADTGKHDRRSDRNRISFDKGIAPNTEPRSFEEIEADTMSDGR